MILTRTVKQQVEATAIRFTIPLRHLDEEDHIADDFPGREGATLTLTIGLDDGIVRDWPKGRAGEVYEKVVDEGVYTLLTSDGTEIVTRKWYVPGFFPEDHYGDYVILDINEDGRVRGWPPHVREVQEWIASFDEE